MRVLYINVVILFGLNLNKNWKQIAIWEDNEEETNNIGRTRAPGTIKSRHINLKRRIEFDSRFRERLVGEGYKNY